MPKCERAVSDARSCPPALTLSPFRLAASIIVLSLLCSIVPSVCLHTQQYVAVFEERGTQLAANYVTTGYKRVTNAV